MRIPVECIANMKLGEIEPMRIRFEDSDGKHVVNIDRIIQCDKSKIPGTITDQIEYKFKCESIKDGCALPFILIYHSQSSKWVMIVK